jgi:hypothetical protein
VGSPSNRPSAGLRPPAAPSGPAVRVASRSLASAGPERTGDAAAARARPFTAGQLGGLFWSIHVHHSPASHSAPGCGMTLSTAHSDARRRRRARQLLFLQAARVDVPDLHLSRGAAFGDAVLHASSSLDESGLRASWRLGRQRLGAMAEFERHHGSVRDVARPAPPSDELAPAPFLPQPPPTNEVRGQPYRLPLLAAGPRAAGD